MWCSRRVLRNYEFAEAGTYNEVVLDAAYFAAKLPASLEALYYRADGGAAAAALARQLQAAFARRFGTAPPVLCFDATRWEAPFSEDDDAGHEGTTEAASASMRSTRDGGVDG